MRRKTLGSAALVLAAFGAATCSDSVGQMMIDAGTMLRQDAGAQDVSALTMEVACSTVETLVRRDQRRATTADPFEDHSVTTNSWYFAETSFRGLDLRTMSVSAVLCDPDEPEVYPNSSTARCIPSDSDTNRTMCEGELPTKRRCRSAEVEIDLDRVRVFCGTSRRDQVIDPPDDRMSKDIFEKAYITVRM